MLKTKEGTIFYFGYGAHRSAELMEALLGRRPDGTKAELKHYREYVQYWSAIPRLVQATLIDYWHPRERFRRYVIRPKRGFSVQGVVWEITPEERMLIGAWELNDGTWVTNSHMMIDREGVGEVMVETDILEHWDNGLSLPTDTKLFLNSKARMCEVAQQVRIRFGI